MRKIPCPRWHGGSCWTTCAALSPPSLPWQPWCWGSAGAGQLWLPLAAPLSSLPPPICSCPGWTWPPGGGGRARGRYHSTVVAGLPGALLQTALQLLFLPYHAWVSACAVCTALWRMGVTGRDLLAWVTADQSERGGGNGLWSYYRREWFSPAVGLATFLLAELRIGSLAGLLWMAAPAAAWWISRPSGKRADWPRRDRAFLLHQATLIWRYFASFLREEDHWLPPDNWQEQPAAGAGPPRPPPPTSGWPCSP